jgi:hypothetical protein
MNVVKHKTEFLDLYLEQIGGSQDEKSRLASYIKENGVYLDIG